MAEPESPPPSKPSHNPWDSYGLMILTSRLSWIKRTNPEIYRLHDQAGKMRMQVNGDQYRDEIEKSRRKTLMVELQDNEKLIQEIEETIKRLKAKIMKQKGEE